MFGIPISRELSRGQYESLTLGAVAVSVRTRRFMSPFLREALYRFFVEGLSLRPFTRINIVCIKRQAEILPESPTAWMVRNPVSSAAICSELAVGIKEQQEDVLKLYRDRRYKELRAQYVDKYGEPKQS